MKSMIAGLLLASATASALLISPAAALAAPADQAGKQCWSAERSNPVTSGPITLFTSYYSVEWCGEGGKVTEFRVIRCEPGELKQAFVRNPDQDCQQREPLGGRQLRIYGNMWAEPTVGLNIEGVELNAGRVNSHYEITLYPNGVITGETS